MSGRNAALRRVPRTLTSFDQADVPERNKVKLLDARPAKSAGTRGYQPPPLPPPETRGGPRRPLRLCVTFGCVMLVLGLGDQAANWSHMPAAWARTLWPKAHAAAPKQTPCDRFGIQWDHTLAKKKLSIYGDRVRRRGSVTECAYLVQTAAGAAVGCYRFDITGNRYRPLGAVDCADPFAPVA